MCKSEQSVIKTGINLTTRGKARTISALLTIAAADDQIAGSSLC